MPKKRKTRETSQEEIIRAIGTILDNPFWIPELELERQYSRLQDDHDGTFQGELGVFFLRNADACVSVTGPRPGCYLRFRDFFGGGQSQRVRNALIVLALAIKRDNETRPQEKPGPATFETHDSP
jgi:hypothetical protein